MRALFAVHFDSYFAELFRVARLLRDTANLDGVFVFAHDEQYQATRDAAVCRDAGFECVRLDRFARGPGPICYGQEFRAPRRTSPARTPVAAARSPTRPSALDGIKVRHSRRTWRDRLQDVGDDLVRCVSFYLAIGRQRGRTRRLLAHYRPDVIFLADDNPVNDSGVWVKVAAARGIPTIVIPYTIADASELLNGIRCSPAVDSYRCSRPLNWLVSRLCPTWTREWNGQRFLREAGSKILAMHAHRLGPHLPWTFFGGDADAVAVESEATGRFLLDQGVPANKLAYTGSASLDILACHARDADRQRRALLAELRLDPDRPVILWGLTLDHLPRIGCDFTSFRDLLEFMVGELRRQTTHTVVVRPHPRVGHEEVRWIEDDGIRLSRRDTAELIPLCGLYIASISASIRWAIACGKPVLNYDVYRYGFTDYAAAGGVVTVQTQRDFAEALARMTGDPAYFADLASRQHGCHETWGRLDGRSAERLGDLIGMLRERHGLCA